jgi:hypothetical protein
LQVCWSNHDNGRVNKNEIVEMRVSTGILTFHDGINHGAFLQAFALQNALKNIGLENEIIDYKSKGFARRELTALLRSRDPSMILRYPGKIRAFRKDQRQLEMTSRCRSKEDVSALAFVQVVIESNPAQNYSRSTIGLKCQILDPGSLEEQLDAPVDWSVCETCVDAAQKVSNQYLEKSQQHE